MWCLAHNEATEEEHDNIMEPCELKIYPCVFCAAEVRSRKELDKHNRAKHVRERAFLKTEVAVHLHMAT